LNQGDGIFAKPVPIPVERSTRSLIAADVTGDGVPDIVTANPGRDIAQVLVNQGGTFAAPSTHAVGERPVAMAAGDLDADGDVDIFVVNRDSQDVTILENQGAGNFAPGRSGLSRNQPALIVAADMTGDDASELLIGDTDGVTLWENDGSGSFKLVETFEGEVFFLQVADFSGDGALDIAVGDVDGVRARLLTNDGAGGFSVESLGTPQTRLGKVGDFDGDGDPDVVLTAEQPDRVVVLLNDEAGTVNVNLQHSFQQFGPDCSAPGCDGINPHDIRSGDVNGDGILDLVVANGHIDSMTVLLGGPGGKFERDGDYPIRNWGHANSIDVADFDLDGDLDAVLSDFEGPNGLVQGEPAKTAQIAVFLNEGDGKYMPPVIYPTGRSAWMVRVADLDGNDTPDLMVANRASDNLTLYFNPGDANFTDRLDIAVGSSPNAVVAADLDEDGDLEVIAANRTSGDLTLLFNDGTGSFPEAALVPVPLAPVHVIAIDTNNDGHVDLVTSHGRDTIFATSLGRGDGTFEAPLAQVLGQFPWSATAADVNQDGILDLAMANEGTNSLSIVLGRGDGLFTFPFRFIAAGSPRFVAAGDFDGDGDTDFASANRFTATISVVVNDTPAATTCDEVDFLTAILTPDDFNAVTVPSERGVVSRSGKYLVPAREDVTLLEALFQNVRRFPLLSEFLAEVFPERFADLTTEAYAALTERRATRDYYTGVLHEITVDGERFGYGFDVDVDGSDPEELLSVDETRAVYEALRASFRLEPLVYFPTTVAGKKAASTWPMTDFEIFIDTGPGGKPTPSPTFELQIPENTEICGTFFVAGGGRDVRREYELKSKVRLRGGVIPLPTKEDAFDETLIEEVRFGPEQTVAEPIAPGTFRVLRLPGADEITTYRFTYEQSFQLPGGSRLDVALVSPQQFRGQGDEALDDPVVWSESFFTRQPGTEAIQARLDGDPLIRYGSCTGELLPLVDVHAELEDGTRVFLQERFEEAESLLETAPANFVSGRVALGETERVVTDYFRLAYSAFRHNVSPSYWVVFDEPMTVTGVGEIHGVELAEERPPDTPAQAAYLGADLQVLANVALAGNIFRSDRDGALFLRGDVTADGSVNIVDALFVLDFLLRGGAAPGCQKAADANDDGRLNLLDPVGTVSLLFRGAAALPAPFEACGADTTRDGLTCDQFEGCAR
jgi:hypothetical protein